MTRCVIVYGTKEGHTARIAARLASELRSAGVEAEVVAASAPPPNFDLNAYDAALVASPLHQGDYHPAVQAFAKANY